MRITNDHHKLMNSGAWRYDNEREIQIVDDHGALWSIRSDRKNGIVITAHGTGRDDEQISAHAVVGNQFILRAGQP